MFLLFSPLFNVVSFRCIWVSGSPAQQVGGFVYTLEYFRPYLHLLPPEINPRSPGLVTQLHPERLKVWPVFLLPVWKTNWAIFRNINALRQIIIFFFCFIMQDWIFGIWQSVWFLLANIKTEVLIITEVKPTSGFTLTFFSVFLFLSPL